MSCRDSSVHGMWVSHMWFHNKRIQSRSSQGEGLLRWGLGVSFQSSSWDPLSLPPRTSVCSPARKCLISRDFFFTAVFIMLIWLIKLLATQVNSIYTPPPNSPAMDPSCEHQPHSNLPFFLVPSLTCILYRDVPGPPHQQNKDTLILQVVLQWVCKVLCQGAQQ